MDSRNADLVADPRAILLATSPCYYNSSRHKGPDDGGRGYPKRLRAHTAEPFVRRSSPIVTLTAGRGQSEEVTMNTNNVQVQIEVHDLLSPRRVPLGIIDDHDSSSRSKTPSHGCVSETIEDITSQSESAEEVDSIKDPDSITTDGTDTSMIHSVRYSTQLDGGAMHGGPAMLDEDVRILVPSTPE
ncbi:hypothetical protein BDR04DRAFT_1165154 [Suillus decipiens]|nr:hypothetical protein BDR04DRAFT_1165154 [Suillus decipiens]